MRTALLIVACLASIAWNLHGMYRNDKLAVAVGQIYVAALLVCVYVSAGE